ncbi:MAG: hypothetical protein ACJAS1_001633 [Oleiphilaceae bacterium]|jgi:hypothetical protein
MNTPANKILNDMPVNKNIAEENILECLNELDFNGVDNEEVQCEEENALWALVVKNLKEGVVVEVSAPKHKGSAHDHSFTGVIVKNNSNGNGSIRVKTSDGLLFDVMADEIDQSYP